MQLYGHVQLTVHMHPTMPHVSLVDVRMNNGAHNNEKIGVVRFLFDSSSANFCLSTT